jgi:pimeloyl-ACP methyl ester carboxylesterase
MAILDYLDVHIEYKEAGHGPAVILIHSTGTGLGQWRKLMDALAPRYRAVAYNRFGYGETSPWPNTRPQTIADQAELAVAVADYVDGPVHLVGHSFGGSVAMKAARALGDRVLSVALLEPNPFHLLQQHGRAVAYEEACALRDLVTVNARRGQWERAAEGFVDYWSAPGTWASMGPERQAAFLKVLPSNVHEWETMESETDNVLTFAPFADRTLVVTARDTVAPIRHISDIMRNCLSGLQLVQIPEGGHMAPVTRPDMVNPLVISHLDRYSSPRVTGAEHLSVGGLLQ